ncbi:hypothetical protein LTR48_003994 [Friedmanniomyces endolithicus]|uniref:Ubiquitin-like domain-containing protein n=1 Tax=Rachicladosporium monterosium TaxID=1507873 RepID=A0ABR0L7U0_9PEZI|nr:hypothetical protein LTR48_003994 [Friedmanniomyces endolithicus]KAK5144318.1 hypothetical protein LTR32_003739 [Rachicladosporium monterosium]
MAPPSPPTHITLTIKVPPGQLEGGADHFPLGSVAVNSTIAAVRQQIQQTIPSNPTPDKQRLLYGGRALVDSEQTLADALNTKRDPTQTEYVVHLLVKGEGQGSSTPAANGHRRVVSTPVGGGAQEQPQVPLPQPQAAEQTLHELHELQVRQHQEQVHRMMLQQQQQHLAQMGMGMPGGGMMPPNPFAGVQPMAGGLQMGGMQFPPGMPFPQQQQLPMMGQGFGQAVALGQQQRAAMGMHGVAPQGQPQGVPQHVGAAQNTNEAPPTIVNGQAGGNQQSENQSQPPNLHTTSATPAGANEQPGQQTQLQAPQQGHPRPVSGQGFHFEGIGPNGQRVQIHHQTMTFPGNAGLPGLPPFAQNPQPQRLPGPPMQPQLPMFPGPQPQAPPSGPSSLDVARDNLAEMRRMLDEMRDSSLSAEEQRNRIEGLRERVQGVDEYIDPLHQPLRPPVNPSDTTCYLLSGPQGPQALLFSPQHGTYNGAFTQGAAVAASRPTPTPTTNATSAQQAGQQPQQNAQQQALAQLVQLPGQGQQPQPGPANPAAAPAPNAQQAAPAAAGAAAADPNAPVQALFNHFWLLFRVLIFAYFLLGSNLGWRRPAALAVIGVGFWMVRAGLFGEGGVARRWWDGVVRVGPPAPAAGAAGGQPGAEGRDGARAGAMPTPEEVARRLIEERRDGRQQRLREFVRPVERAVALFVASLWPGIGEAHVRAQEAEVQRRRDEEEVAGRRREEEEARRVEVEREKERGGDGEKGSVGVDVGGTEGSASAGGSSTVPATDGVKKAAPGSGVEGATAGGA